MDKPKCCFIPEDQQEAARRGEKVQGCQKDAEYTIYYDGPPHANYTEACTDHVGHLLTDAKEHTVIQIGEQK